MTEFFFLLVYHTYTCTGSNSSLELFLVLMFNGEKPRIYYANPWKNVWIYWNFNTSSWMLNNFKSRITGSTVGNQHKQNSRFCKEIREDNFLFLWRRVHEDASQGMYMSKIEICFFTARILQNQRMICCGECFHD